MTLPVRMIVEIVHFIGLLWWLPWHLWQVVNCNTRCMYSVQCGKLSIKLDSYDRKAITQDIYDLIFLV